MKRFYALLLTAVMVLDYITGMMKAYLCGELSSRKGLRGILKKLGYLAVVASGAVVDWILSRAMLQLEVQSPPSLLFSLLITVWLILNELISILENLSAIGVPMPRFLKGLIDRLAMGVEKRGEKGLDTEQGDENKEDFHDSN